MKTFFEWIAILRGNSVNINFELYPAKEIGEEYEDYVYSLEKMVEIFNKNPKVINGFCEFLITKSNGAKFLVNPSGRTIFIFSVIKTS